MAGAEVADAKARPDEINELVQPALAESIAFGGVVFLHKFEPLVGNLEEERVLVHDLAEVGFIEQEPKLLVGFRLVRAEEVEHAVDGGGVLIPALRPVHTRFATSHAIPPSWKPGGLLWSVLSARFQ